MSSRAERPASSAPLEVAEARRLLLGRVERGESEQVALAECRGRVTAAALRAPVALPGFDNSAMDGYAMRAADAGGELPVVAESRAGHPAPRGPGPGEAVRISTGAMLPAGADAVVPQERAELGDGVLRVEGPVAAGDHVRRAGEDLAAGAEALPAGRRLGAAELGVLAALGVEALPCVRRPTVAILTSGDELRGPGEPLGPGDIHDASRFALPALAAAAGAEPRFAGVVADDPESTREAIAAALDADFVAIAGGVSVGPHDHVKAALAELGVEQLFWRLAMRPGGPTWAGVGSGGGSPTVVLGLPGNPVSSFAIFHLLGRAAIRVALGLDPDDDRAEATLAERYEKPAGRAQYLRCRLTATASGWSAALTTERQGSHVLSSLLGADCLAVIPAERTAVEAGERVEVRLLGEWAG